MMDWMIGCIIAFAAMGIGNWLGDQGILRDCATKGRAGMMGGGIIACNVERQDEYKAKSSVTPPTDERK